MNSRSFFFSMLGDASSNGHDAAYSGYNDRQAVSSVSGADVMANVFSGLRIGNTNTNTSTNANNNMNNTTTATGDADAIAPKSLSPLPPSSISPPASFLQPQQTRGTQSKSPQLPQAPVQGTVPLPQVEEEYDHARRLQSLQHEQDLHNINNSNHYHTGHEQRPNLNPNPKPTILQVGAAIDLAGLSIGAGRGQSPTEGYHLDSQQYQQQQQTISLGLPSSQSQPMFSSSSASPMDSGAGFPTSVSDSGMAAGGVQKTANVYINGLPPHFPEDQLFALAAPFGGVRSVRTFTRHVRDSESGYGFVL
jgi:hypothetical protein